MLRDCIQDGGPGEGGRCFNLLHHTIEGELQLCTLLCILRLLLFLRQPRSPDLLRCRLLRLSDSSLLATLDVQRVMHRSDVAAAARVSAGVPAGAAPFNGQYLGIFSTPVMVSNAQRKPIFITHLQIMHQRPVSTDEIPIFSDLNSFVWCSEKMVRRSAVESALVVVSSGKSKSGSLAFSSYK